jgi:hypothetical protein
VAHPSDSEGPLAVGSYSFRAVYSGDTNYNPSTSDCEPFTVVKADTSTVTQIHNGDDHNTNVSNVPLGSTVHDSATVTGTSFGVPTGNVTFTFFTTATDCTGPSVGAGTVDLVNGVAHPSASEGPLGAGSYSFLAVYNGDANYNPSTAQCEPLTVDKADTSSTTALHDPNHNVIPINSSVPLGTVVHDSATVTGTSFGVPTGTVTFTFFTASGDCTGASVGAGTVPLNINGVADPSQAQGPLAAGSYSFRAVYNGDSNYGASTSGCEPFTVNKANTSTATDVHDADHHVVTSVPLGSTVHDKATVTGTAFGAPTGTVHFTWFTNGECSGDGQSAGDVPLVNGVADPSNAFGPLGAGDYSFRATYGGDSNYNGSTGPCEPLTVEQGTTQTATTIHDKDHHTVTSVPLGSTVHDSASVSGSSSSFAPTGTVTFRWFTNDQCTGEGVAAGSATLSNGIAHPSDSEGPLAAGGYAFKATYTGNANYKSSTGPCEPLKVDKGTSNTKTDIHNSKHDVVTKVDLGSTVHDSATVSGSSSAFAPTGTVTFRWFTNKDCAGDGVAAGSATLSNGVAHPSSNEGPLAAGGYAFKASYPGDGNYGPSTGPCEPLKVDKGTTVVKTDIHDSKHHVVTKVDLGTTVHDSASVSGSSSSIAPTGTVTFRWFTNDDCKGDGVGAGTATISNGVAHPSSNEGPLAAGRYAFKASYAGDANYDGSIGFCEKLKVEKGASVVKTDIHDSKHGVVTTVPHGSTVHDSALVSGSSSSFAPTGTVTFRWFTNDDCKGDGVAAGSATIVNNVAHPSSNEGPLEAGGYAFKASYKGDDNYEGSIGSCERLKVEKAPTPVPPKPVPPAPKPVTPVQQAAPPVKPASSGGLAYTGTNAFRFGVIGAALVAAGAVLLLVTRRRRKANSLGN